MRLPAGDTKLVQIVDAALAEAARLAGPHLACRPGCAHCCHGAFAINQLDTLRLQEGMKKLREQQPQVAEAVTARAQAWLAAHRDAFPGDPETGLLGSTDEDRESFEDFANEAACPALDSATSRCDLYAHRPMTCRVFGPPVRVDAGTQETADQLALAHCELCFTGATQAEVAACEMQVPHDLEAQLIAEIPHGGETVVAFALLA